MYYQALISYTTNNENFVKEVEYQSDDEFRAVRDGLLHAERLRKGVGGTSTHIRVREYVVPYIDDEGELVRINAPYIFSWNHSDPKVLREFLRRIREDNNRNEEEDGE